MNFWPVTFIIIKSFLWFTIGSMFGFATFILLFVSKSLYGLPFDIHHYVNYEFVMYLCVSLMAGAASDWANYPDRVFTNRIFPLVFCFMLLLIILIIFNPAVKEQPKEIVVKDAAIVYSIVAFVFCMIIKGIIFSEECSDIKTVKF